LRYLAVLRTAMYLVGSYLFSLQAVKAAVYMLENDAGIEEVKTVCAPSDLFQIAKWKVIMKLSSCCS
jgi:hypothetical protein